jgi:hypothetical protein
LLRVRVLLKDYETGCQVYWHLHLQRTPMRWSNPLNYK